MKLHSIGFAVLGLVILTGCAKNESAGSSSTPATAATSASPSAPAAAAEADAATEAARLEAQCAAERHGMLPESGKCPEYAWSPAAKHETRPLIGTPSVRQTMMAAIDGKSGDVEAKMRNAFPKFLRCYGPTKQRAEGLINVRFATNEAGAVEKVFATKETTIPDPAVVDCVVREVRAIKFSGPVRVEYTLAFEGTKHF